MELCVYEKIVETICKNRNLSKNEIYELLRKKEKIEVKTETYTSIYASLKRRQMFKPKDPNLINLKKLKENSVVLYNRYVEYEQEERRQQQQHQQTNLILKMASELMVSPVMLSRALLEGAKIKDALEIAPVVSSSKAIPYSQLIKETHLLKNGRLAYEIWECCCVDDDFGPVIDVIRNLVGVEEEARLEKWLTDRKIAFVREDELRQRGYDKTPDFMLECPIFLSAGIVVNWIDSKASFCDVDTHKENYNNQFKFYLNRFGPGMVIYSYGFVRDVDKLACNFNAGTAKRVIYVCDRFPLDYTTLDLDSIEDEQI